MSFPLSIFGPRSPSPASLPGHHENHLIWVDLSLMAPLELRLFHWVSFSHSWLGPASLPGHHNDHLSGLERHGPPLSHHWPPLMRSNLTAWQPWKPSDLSGLSPGSTPWISCRFVLKFPLSFHYDGFCLFNDFILFTFCVVFSLLFCYCLNSLNTVFWSWKGIPGISIPHWTTTS